MGITSIHSQSLQSFIVVATALLNASTETKREKYFKFFTRYHSLLYVHSPFVCLCDERKSGEMTWPLFVERHRRLLPPMECTRVPLSTIPGKLKRCNTSWDIFYPSKEQRLAQKLVWNFRSSLIFISSESIKGKDASKKWILARAWKEYYENPFSGLAVKAEQILKRFLYESDDYQENDAFLIIRTGVTRFITLINIAIEECEDELYDSAIEKLTILLVNFLEYLSTFLNQHKLSTLSAFTESFADACETINSRTVEQRLGKIVVLLNREVMKSHPNSQTSPEEFLQLVRSNLKVVEQLLTPSKMCGESHFGASALRLFHSDDIDIYKSVCLDSMDAALKILPTPLASKTTCWDPSIQNITLTCLLVLDVLQILNKETLNSSSSMSNDPLPDQLLSSLKPTISSKSSDTFSPDVISRVSSINSCAAKVFFDESTSNEEMLAVLLWIVKIMEWPQLTSEEFSNTTKLCDVLHRRLSAATQDCRIAHLLHFCFALDLDIADSWLKIMQQQTLAQMEFSHFPEVQGIKRFRNPQVRKGVIASWQVAMNRLQNLVGYSTPTEDTISCTEESLEDSQDDEMPDASSVTQRYQMENQFEKESELDETIFEDELNTTSVSHEIPFHTASFSGAIDPILLSLVQMSSLSHFPAEYLESIGFPITLNHLIRRSFASLDLLLVRLNALKKNHISSTFETRSKPIRKILPHEEIEELNQKILFQWRRLATMFRLLANFVSRLSSNSQHEPWVTESMSISLCCQYLIAALLIEREMIPGVCGPFQQSTKYVPPSGFAYSITPPSAVYYDALRAFMNLINLGSETSHNTRYSDGIFPTYISSDIRGKQILPDPLALILTCSMDASQKIDKEVLTNHLIAALQFYGVFKTGHLSTQKLQHIRGSKQSKSIDSETLQEAVDIVFVHGMRGCGLKTWRWICPESFKYKIIGGASTEQGSNDIPDYVRRPIIDSEPIEDSISPNEPNSSYHLTSINFSPYQHFKVKFKVVQTDVSTVEASDLNVATEEPGTDATWHFHWPQMYLQSILEKNSRILMVDFDAPLFKKKPVLERIHQDPSEPLSSIHETTDRRNNDAETKESRLQKSVIETLQHVISSPLDLMTQLTGEDRFEVDWGVQPSSLPISTPIMTLSQIASLLVGRLEEANVGNNDRRLVWVAHSMGGLLVKNMLLMNEHLAKRTKAVIFFGVPHFGSPMASEFRILQRVVAPYCKELHPTRFRDRFIQLNDQFRDLCRTYNIGVLSFSETEKTPIPYLSKLIPRYHRYIVPPEYADPGKQPRDASWFLVPIIDGLQSLFLVTVVTVFHPYTTDIHNTYRMIAGYGAFAPIPDVNHTRMCFLANPDDRFKLLLKLIQS